MITNYHRPTYDRCRPATVVGGRQITATARHLALLATTTLVVLVAAASAFGTGSVCNTVKFFGTKGQVKPTSFGWASSGVRYGSNLLVVDWHEKNLVEITEDGEFVATIESLRSLKTGEVVELIEPSLLMPRRAGGFLLLDDALSKPGRILAITPDLFVEKEMRVEDEKGMRVEDRILGGALLTGVFKFVELGDGVLMFADLEDPEAESGDPDKYWSRFVYLGFDGSHQFFGDRVPFEIKDYFVRDFSPMASTSPDDAFVLMFDPEESWIAHISLEKGTMDRLAALSTDFARAPKLERDPELLGDKTKTDEQLYRFYKLFEESQMPMSLVAADHLYLVAKGAIGDNQRTPWYLVRLSPVTGKEISRTRLPTYAPHIMAPILGSDRAVVIEKGKFVLRGPKIYTTYRETNSMVVFPNAWLEGHAFEKTGSYVLFDCKPLSGKG